MMVFPHSRIGVILQILDHALNRSTEPTKCDRRKYKDVPMTNFNRREMFAIAAAAAAYLATTTALVAANRSPNEKE